MMTVNRSGISLLALLLVTSSAAVAQTGANYLPWLLGCWSSTDSEPVETERWIASGNSLNGTREVVKNGATVIIERMTIRRDATGTVVFTATPSGQAEASFYMVKIGADEVVFENREHDFPQRIIYRLLPGFNLLGRIEGVVDGQAKAVDFPMTRADCT
jgi:hypothetical protein